MADGSDNDAVVQQLNQLMEQLKLAERRADEADLKGTSQYWDTFDDLWDFDLSAYDGLFEQTWSLRQKKTPLIYSNAHDLLMNGEGIEAVLGCNSVFFSNRADREHRHNGFACGHI